MLLMEFTSREVLCTALRLIEQIHQNAQTGKRLAPTLLAPHLECAFRMVLDSSVHRHQATAFSSETLTPEFAALHLLGMEAKVSISTIAAHKNTPSDFTRLVQASGRLASAPLFLVADDQELSGDSADVFHRHVGGRLPSLVVLECRHAGQIAGRQAAMMAFARNNGVRVILSVGHSEAECRSNGTRWRTA